MPSSPHDTRDAFVDAAVRRARRRGGAVALRTALVQHGTQSRPVPGPLHRLVRAHDERALDLYLLLRVLASSDEITEEWDVRLKAAAWARGLGLPTPHNDGSAAVSKTWKRLEDHGLIARTRQARRANVVVLNESGDGSPYAYPSGKGYGRYFKLSEDYWTAEDRWYRTLSLAAKAMLLIISSLKPASALPEDQVPGWYGVSTDTAVKGIRELADKGLLDVTKHRRDTPLGDQVYVIEHRYTLLAPFAQNWRADAASPPTPSTADISGGATVTQLHPAGAANTPPASPPAAPAGSAG